MSLPFLKKKNQDSGIAIKYRAPDEKPQEEPEEDTDGLEACAMDIIRAIHEDNPKALAGAFRAAFEILESTPHDEYQDEEE